MSKHTKQSYNRFYTQREINCENDMNIMSVGDWRKMTKGRHGWKLIVKEARVLHGLYSHWRDRERNKLLHVLTHFFEHLNIRRWPVCDKFDYSRARTHTDMNRPRRGRVTACVCLRFT